MSWARVFVLSVLTTLFVITCEYLVLVGGEKSGGSAAQQVFMPESDASNFFKRRNRRSVRYYEFLAEQRVKRAADERRREYNEEQRNEYENYVEEDRDEKCQQSNNPVRVKPSVRVGTQRGDPDPQFAV
uniref:Unique cartilage matrix-associated protein n=1 Tax=Neolamprologus brichardi TaxID=32507 RepID=A0A3Q4HL89_NEOBR